ncbi:zinc finger protein PLAG1-like [Anneissia japonica]|uniref:zinc finger protein PLAG1-like n=1 Tax=Anneissia japonica TaxID=1529436 RepID=UPI0014256D4A|nr:zinc finger protein PLAG1-like [Anneissia japonica]XP_033110078.1 zinc finger protein PLAG1-like [Anneissia japonica]
MAKDPLWCEDCGKSHVGECPVHGSLTRVRDKVIPSHARLTLPHHMVLKELELRTGNQQILGVFARKLIQRRTQFGPFIAPRSLTKVETNNNDTHRPCYKIFQDNLQQAILDTSCEDVCNWMMFVRPAEEYFEQNVVAYQWNNDVYFTTSKPIPPHTELKVWYAAEYANKMQTKLLYNPLSTTKTESPQVSVMQSSSQAGGSHLSTPEYDFTDVTENPQEEFKPDLSMLQSSSNLNDPQASSSLQPTTLSDPWKCSTCNRGFSTFSLLEVHTCETGKPRRGRKPKSKKMTGAQTSSSNPRDGPLTRAGKQMIVLKTGKEKLIGRHGKGRKHKEQVTFSCDQCSKIFLNMEKLKTHSYMHSGERPFICTKPDCKKAFISSYKLSRHMATHSPEKTHHCQYCDKKFHRKDHLKNHLQTHDPNKESFHCENCSKVYNTKPGFKKHIAMHAADAGELTCKVCDRDFENTDVLIEHIKVHSGKSNGAKEKKHKCDDCDRKFYTRKDVRRHMVVHTGQKNFLCQTCGQRFGRKDHLVRHTRKSHNGEQFGMKMGEHLRAVGTATVHQILQQHLDELAPLPMSDFVPNAPSSLGQPPPNDVDLIKVPPVPHIRSHGRVMVERSQTDVRISPKIGSNMKESPAGMSMDMGMMDTGRDNKDMQDLTDTLNPNSYDLGRLLGFLPINQPMQQTANPPHTASASMPMKQSPSALPQSSAYVTQSELPHSQPMTMPNQGIQSQTVRYPSAQSGMSQGQYNQPMIQGLPRFHQAFQ